MSSKPVIIRKRVNRFNQVISVSGDKSISIRWVLFSSLASGTSKARNLLISQDVLASIKAIKKPLETIQEYLKSTENIEK